ncbi:MAG: hypothetical protein WKG07_09220 [Hymenobacter sp.]
MPCPLSALDVVAALDNLAAVLRGRRGLDHSAPGNFIGLHRWAATLR